MCSRSNEILLWIINISVGSSEEHSTEWLKMLTRTTLRECLDGSTFEPRHTGSCVLVTKKYRNFGGNLVFRKNEKSHLGKNIRMYVFGSDFKLKALYLENASTDHAENFRYVYSVPFFKSISVWVYDKNASN